MAKPAKVGGINSVSVWEDDPETGVLVSRPIPDVANKPLAFGFPKPAPKPGVYPPGGADFRYWTAAEALRRGADFWSVRVPLTKWQVGATLKVILDEGDDLNAYYDREALNFFHGHSPTGTVYSGESPDVVCHEMGHAVLDSFKPELWDAGSQEVAAFHESFADISAILSAIQLPSLRTSILQDTSGRLYRNSRLSRLAEQLGTAIRAQHPDAVDSDCLRNAVNSFTYQDPTTLPGSAPASQLSSEPHSFSRVFTGAFFESLGAALSAKAQNPAMPTSAELLSVANDLAGILVNAIKASPVVSNWYAQVAANMVIAAGSVDAKYPPIIKAIYVRRAILSLHSAASIAYVPPVRAAVAAAPASAHEELAETALPAGHYGISGVLFVKTASQSRQFVALSAAGDSSSIEPLGASTAAQAFVDDLFSRGRIDYADVVAPEAQLNHGHKLKSHRLVKTSGGARLDRLLFDCGCRNMI
ncbi:hypothetical protein EOA30_04950 [Mesorhizobium sp. M8A.F.Ca.ET.059.01.1.1]|nr:hypothetical protein EOA30_04950 [Mesorhizobium sp. M8A.F.Ca.ET.059.01.1.1]